MTVTSAYHPQAVYDRQKAFDLFLVQADNIATGLADPVFAAEVTLQTLNGTLKVQIVTLREKQKVATGPVKSHASFLDRDGAQEAVAGTIVEIVHAVTKFVAKLSPAAASAAIVKAGLRERLHVVPELEDITLADGPNSGDTKMRVKSPVPGKRLTIQMQVSADGGKTWPYEETGSNLSFTFENLVVGTAHIFRFRYRLGKKKWSDWTTSKPYTVR